MQYTVRSSLKQVDTAEGTEASLKLHKENNVVFTGQHVQKYFIDIPNKTKIGPDSGFNPCNSLNNRVTGLIQSVRSLPSRRSYTENLRGDEDDSNEILTSVSSTELITIIPTCSTCNL